MKKILLFGTLLWFCIWPMSGGSGRIEAADQSGKAKELTLSWPVDIGNLNPHLYGPSQMFAQALLFDPLVIYGHEGKILPGLAERWEVSPDGKVLTFHLRQGVKFSDGTAFNALVAKQNLEAVLANRERHAWLELIKQMEQVEVVNDSALKIYLKNAYYPAFQEFALVRPVRFLSPTAFPDDGDTSKGIKKPIGTGPWVLTEHRKNAYAIFTRNEHYWGTKPALQKVTVKIIPDGETRVLAFEKGEIDLIFGNGLISLDAFKQLQDSGKYETLISPPLSTRVLALNSNKGPTKEWKVRQAIQHGFNKEAVIEAVFYGTEQKADTLFSPTIPYCNLGLKPYEYDVEKAKRLLDEAGWKLAGNKLFREKEGETLAVELSFKSTDSVQKTIAEVMQGDLQKIGIFVKLVGEEEQAHYQRQKDGNFHLIFNDTWGPPYDPHSFVSSMRKPSHADYQAQAGLPMKAEVDQKISEVLLTTEEKTRQEMYAYILGTLHEQAVYLPISYNTNLAVYRKNFLKGFVFLPTQYEIPLSNLDIY